MKRKSIGLLALLIWLLPLCACGAAETQTEAAASIEPSAALNIQAETEPAPTPTPAPTPSPTPAPTPEPLARELTEICDAGRVGHGSDPWFLDNRRSTYHLNDSGVSVRCREPIGAISLVWFFPPEEYTISYGETRVPCGQRGLMHEYVRLPEATSELLIEATGTRLCDVRVFSEGRPPEDVQVWQEPEGTADVLVFPTHADDDVLFLGAFTAQCVERGLTVQTAFMCSHDDYQLREHERLDAQWVLGVRREPLIYGAPDIHAHSLDHARYCFDEQDVIRWQTEQIRKFQPLIIIGHDLNGEYGHGAHIFYAHCLMAAVEAAADPEQYPESAELYGVWDTPKTYLHLGKTDPMELSVDEPLARFDGKTAYEVAVEAMRCHVSQEESTGFSVRKDGNPRADCRYFGLERSLVGEDTGNDFLEHLTLRTP